MEYWFDPLTPKQANLLSTIANHYERMNIEYLITTRDYNLTRSVLDTHKVRYSSFGIHGGGSLEGKLQSGIDRMNLLLKFLKDRKTLPDKFISCSSPEGTRVAFGLGIPVYQCVNTPHAVAVGKLTYSLSKGIILPEYLRPKLPELYQLGVNSDTIEFYKGTDEIAYLQKLSTQDYSNIDLPEEPYIIFRPGESLAAYWEETGISSNEILQILIKEYNGSILCFPRYAYQEKELLNLKSNNLILVDKSYPVYPLLKNADAIITGGGTMAWEAALIGTPAFYFFHSKLLISDYLKSLQCPIWYLDSHSVKTVLHSFFQDPDQLSRFSKEVFRNLESPIDALNRLFRKEDY